MRTHRDFCRHRTTGQIYPVQMTWAGEVVGSAGPLREGEIWPPDQYVYTPDRNGWISHNNDKLISMDAEALKGLSNGQDY